MLTDAGLEIRLDPVDASVMSIRYPGSFRARPDEAGQFVLRDVVPGEYKVSTIQKEPAEWFLDSVMIGGRDVTRQPVQVKREDLTGVTVTLTDRRAELWGTIMTDKGEPAPEYYILIYPADEHDWTPGVVFMSGTRPKPDGTYLGSGLRPGPYRLATILDVEFGAWFDPAYLRRIDPDSRTVTLAGTERKTLNLRVPGGR